MEIILKSIRAVNFMACDDKTFAFDGNTLVSGMNGKGKSTIASAYMWLIFNCDSELRDNPFVRRKIGGEPVNDMDVSVEAVFEFNGREITAKKVQKRTFKKDGSYSDDNVYFINECPKTLKAFNEYFETDMKVFKMCSNMAIFLSKKDKEMREYLFGKIEDVSDLEIATKNEELVELATLLRGYKAEEIAAMNKASVAKINKELPILNGQIKEKERDVTAGTDVDLAELELLRNSLKEQIAENQAKQTDVSKQLEGYQRQTDDILKLKFKLSDMEREASDRNNDAKAEKRKELQKLQSECDMSRDEIKRREYRVAEYEKNLERHRKEIEKCREDWKRANDRVFDENSLVCPYCGQEYPEEKKEALRAEFESRKADELSGITEKGNRLKEEIAKYKSEIETNKTAEAEEKKKADELSAKIEAAQKEHDEIPDLTDLFQNAEYTALQKEISEKESTLEKESSADEIRKTLKAEEEDLRSQLSEIEMKIAAADKTKDEERLEELKTQRLDLEQKKSDSEKALNLLDELDKLKNETLSEEINSLFGLVEWKLFDYQKNGGYKNCCVPMVDKKSILTTESNTGNRFLGQTDILNSLQRIEGISCPVFIDGAEALDTENLKKAVGMMNCQVIALKVSDGAELTLEGIGRKE